MKITIIGGGNMGGAIGQGLADGSYFNAQNITIINQSKMRDYGCNVNVVLSDYSSLEKADIVIIAVKPWLVESILKEHGVSLSNPKQLLISVAANISLEQLSMLSVNRKPVFRVMPNTAISQKQSMTFISSLNADAKQKELVLNMFDELGNAEFIDENLFSGATSLSSCGIAFAFRYIRAAIEGGVEMGLNPSQAKNAVLQTLRGAVELLEANGTHPEEEIDKVTTPGGITIKGLNEMEHAGFTSAVIRGLKASNAK